MYVPTKKYLKSSRNYHSLPIVLLKVNFITSGKMILMAPSTECKFQYFQIDVFVLKYSIKKIKATYPFVISTYFLHLCWQQTLAQVSIFHKIPWISLESRFLALFIFLKLSHIYETVRDVIYRQPLTIFYYIMPRCDNIKGRKAPTRRLYPTKNVPCIIIKASNNPIHHLLSVSIRDVTSFKHNVRIFKRV